MPLVSKAFGDIITFTRASTGSYFDATGTLQSAAINAPRFDYNPSTLAAQGLLIEEQRTNGIRNNTMVGAVAGTPGTAPTNWVISNPADGITPQIVGTGISNGITYIDVKYTGTSGAAATTTLIQFESNTQIAALNEQTWTSSTYVAIVGGSTANVSALVLRTRFNAAAGTNLTTTDVSITAATSALSRFSVTGTSTDATTAFVNSTIVANFVDNSAIDITLRIGLPQLEQGAFATSVIPTTTAAVTRSADSAKLAALAPWYNQTEGTVYAEFQSLSPLTATQSVGLNKYPPLWYIDAGALDSAVTWYGVGAEMNISGTFNNIGTVPSGINKFAVSLAASGGQSRSSLNGAAAINRNGALSVTATQFFLGRDSGGTKQLCGWLRRLTYYPRALSAAEIQTITG